MDFVENCKNGVVYMTSPVIKANHGFSTRHGGVSTGIFESLNLAVSRGDERENVVENYRRLGEATGVDLKHVAFTNQVHGNEVRIVDREDEHILFTPVPYEADGIVTDKPGLALICFSADCIPVLLCDGKNSVIGAVHCGWRGSVADILRVAVEKMESLGAEREHICAAIGPAISKCCFEVGPEVVEAAEKLVGPQAELWEPEEGVPGKFMLDLKGVNRLRLLQLGLKDENISVSSECTRCLGTKYWSHRGTHGQRGVQGAVIML